MVQFFCGAFRFVSNEGSYCSVDKSLLNLVRDLFYLKQKQLHTHILIVGRWGMRSH